MFPFDGSIDGLVLESPAGDFSGSVGIRSGVREPGATAFVAPVTGSWASGGCDAIPG